MRKVFIAVLGMAVMALSAGDVLANPWGLRDGTVGKKLAQFNVILKPNEWDGGGNACNGSRIFFWDDNGNTMGNINWYLGPLEVNSFKITDCDGTDGASSVQVPDDLGDTIVAIRVMGPASSNLQFVCTVLVDNVDSSGSGEDLCVIDAVDLNKSKSFTKVMMNIADADFEHVLWDQFNNDWKIFQVRIHEWIRD